MQQINIDAGQDDVRTTLYERYASTILAYVCQQVASRQDAEDLLVEVFMFCLTTLPYKCILDTSQYMLVARDEYRLGTGTASQG